MRFFGWKGIASHIDARKLANQIARLVAKIVKHRIDQAQQHLLLACNTETSTCHFDNVFYLKKLLIRGPKQKNIQHVCLTYTIYSYA